MELAGEGGRQRASGATASFGRHVIVDVIVIVIIIAIDNAIARGEGRGGRFTSARSTTGAAINGSHRHRRWTVGCWVRYRVIVDAIVLQVVVLMLLMLLLMVLVVVRTTAILWQKFAMFAFTVRWLLRVVLLVLVVVSERTVEHVIIVIVAGGGGAEVIVGMMVLLVLVVARTDGRRRGRADAGRRRMETLDAMVIGVE